MNSKGKVGFEEKSPIHIADVVRMYEMSTSRLNDEEPERSAELEVRSILKTAGSEADEAPTVGPKRKVRFELQAPGNDGHDRPRRAASELKRPNRHQDDSTKRSTHDSEQLADAVSPAKVSRRPEESVHKLVPDADPRHKFNDGTLSSRTVTRYDANSSDVILDWPVEQNLPNILKRDSMPVDAGYDIFVAQSRS